jgi:hypothetical protein
MYKSPLKTTQKPAKHTTLLVISHLFTIKGGANISQIREKLTLLLTAILVTFFSIPLAQANIENETLDVSDVFNTTGQKQFASISDFIVTTINFILNFATAVIMGVIVIAGLRFISAGGEENAVQRGKDILINALIGLIIVLAAKAIVLFVEFLFYQPTTATP